MLNREIRIRIPRFSNRRWALLGLLVVLVASGVYASVTFTAFAPNEKLSSAKMNANFQGLTDGINQGLPKPHLVLTQGNVDLGVYLGQYVFWNGSFSVSLTLVQHPSLQAPLPVAGTNGYIVQSYILFTQANCTGTPFLDKNSPPTIPFANAAFNTSEGTIFQLNGSAQNQVHASTAQYNNGMRTCQNINPAVIQNAILLKDTKVPNVIVPDLAQTSLVMM